MMGGGEKLGSHGEGNCMPENAQLHIEKKKRVNR